MKCLEHEVSETGNENIFEKLNTGAEVPQETAQYLHEMLSDVHHQCKKTKQIQNLT